MKWIKASDRKPKKYKEVFIRFMTGKKLIKSSGHWDGETFWVHHHDYLDSFEGEELIKVEWLDESIDQEVHENLSKIHADWKEKFQEWYYANGRNDVYKYMDWIEENVIAPLLQNELKGDDLESSSNGSKAASVSMIRSGFASQIEQLKNFIKEQKEEALSEYAKAPEQDEEIISMYAAENMAYGMILNEIDKIFGTNTSSQTLTQIEQDKKQTL